MALRILFVLLYGTLAAGFAAQERYPYAGLLALGALIYLTVCVSDARGRVLRRRP